MSFLDISVEMYCVACLLVSKTLRILQELRSCIWTYKVRVCFSEWVSGILPLPNFLTRLVVLDEPLTTKDQGLDTELYKWKALAAFQELPLTVLEVRK